MLAAAPPVPRRRPSSLQGLRAGSQASRPGAPRVAGLVAAAARSRALGGGGSTTGYGVLTCFPAVERRGDNGLQDVRRRVV
jgi:hypothetical protein